MQLAFRAKQTGRKGGVSYWYLSPFDGGEPLRVPRGPVLMFYALPHQSCCGSAYTVAVTLD